MWNRRTNSWRHLLYPNCSTSDSACLSASSVFRWILVCRVPGTALGECGAVPGEWLWRLMVGEERGWARGEVCLDCGFRWRDGDLAGSVCFWCLCSHCCCYRSKEINIVIHQFCFLSSPVAAHHPFWRYSLHLLEEKTIADSSSHRFSILFLLASFAHSLRPPLSN